MASCQLCRIPKRKGCTDLERGDSRKGGSQFPVRIHRIVAFELVLFTCSQLVLSNNTINLWEAHLPTWTT